MVNHKKYSTVDTQADSEFVEALAETVAQMIPGITVAEATIKLEEAGLGMARGDLYAQALEIIQGTPSP